VLCWAMPSPYFEIQEPLQTMNSMLPHKSKIISPSIILLLCVDGVWKDGMIRAGKVRVWKQWANFCQGLGM
jgi:hypothetical protein